MKSVTEQGTSMGNGGLVLLGSSGDHGGHPFKVMCQRNQETVVLILWLASSVVRAASGALSPQVTAAGQSHHTPEWQCAEGMGQDTDRSIA